MIGLGVCEEACLSINAARIALVDDLVEALCDFSFSQDGQECLKWLKHADLEDLPSWTSLSKTEESYQERHMLLYVNKP